METKDESNFIIFLPTPIFSSSGFTDKLEAELFHDTLVEAQEKGKNIIVVHGGSISSADLKDGIRYIQLNTKELTSPEDIKDLHAVKFYVDSYKISYEFVKIF